MSQKNWIDYNVERRVVIKTGNFCFICNPFVNPVVYSLFTNISKYISYTVFTVCENNLNACIWMTNRGFFLGEVRMVFGLRILEYTTALCRGHYDYLEHLSDSLLLRIINYLELEDVGQLGRTSRRFRKVSLINMQINLLPKINCIIGY